MRDTGNARHQLFNTPEGTTLYRADAFDSTGRLASVTLTLGRITDRADAIFAPIKVLNHDPLGRTPDRIGVHTSAGVIPVEDLYFTEDGAATEALERAQRAHDHSATEFARTYDDLERAQLAMRTLRFEERRRRRTAAPTS